MRYHLAMDERVTPVDQDDPIPAEEETLAPGEADVTEAGAAEDDGPDEIGAWPDEDDE